jgi:hypothetical protein
MIRNAREIGGHVHACGSKRQVFKRTGDRQWIDMSAPRAAQTEVFGFEAIDGYAGQRDLRRRLGRRDLAPRRRGVDAVRQPHQRHPHGRLLRGQWPRVCRRAGRRAAERTHDAWTPVDWEDEVTADLWDLCWFQDRLYVATMSGLYTLDANRLVPVDYGAMGPVTGYSLSTAQGVLWSVGKADVASFDGTAWRKYD